MKWKLTECEH